MQLSPEQRFAKLARWTNPPSEAEEQRLERARRMVTRAVQQHPRFAGLKLSVDAKGSWANNTNVRSESDVDIKVEFTQRAYHGVSASGMTFWELAQQRNSYNGPGPWTPEEFREELGVALKAVSSAVDATHNVAFYVPDVPGSRPSTDVVPCFTYLHQPGWSRPTAQGTVVFTRDGKHIVNWSHQQLVNGREKNKRTGHRYKFAVRALKAVENDLVRLGEINDLPSYFMECLIYNVPDAVLKAGSLDTAFEGALTHLRQQVHFWWGDPNALIEPNEIKKLFQSGQKWKIDDARQLLNAAWHYLNYG
ncbi:nucleotidyltransferase family protein [Streptomyces justiciae]|uniref:nucleotidyltransferase n=1 Tax=Streptomyces justiciae TaxID=2780140 RepID=UPI0018812A7D|nr:nucleotidyltransferase [Streptomyces justiciae]MBE8471598.1 nucleotidyltransferase [Streptomyces justiciae]